MKNIIVPVKNVSKLMEQGRALMNRPERLNHGLGVLDGPSGVGKTTATAWFAVQNNAHYIRAMAAWRTPTPLLRAICDEIGIQPRRSQMLNGIAQKMAQENRPLFIDEANYLMRFDILRDTIMDLHDITTVPIILIGMTGIRKQIRGSGNSENAEKFENRFLVDVRFEPLDMEDTRLLADQICEVEVADDLLQDLHKDARGNTRRIATGLYRIEQLAPRGGGGGGEKVVMDLERFRQCNGTYFLGVSV